MLNFNKKESRVKLFLRKNGLYIALACCLVASGTAAWRYLGTGNISTVQESGTDSGIVTEKAPEYTQNWDETLPEGEEAGANKTDVPDEREETETQAQTEPETEEEVTEPASMVNNELNTPYQSFYMMPCGTEIINDYSNGEMVYSETMDDWRSHNGVDFKAEKGVSVKAINDGIVTNVYTDALWGTIVEIDHGGKLVAKYCGLGADVSVQKGTEVKMGDEIGVLGDIPCESKLGNHLHLEIRIDSKIVDPLAAMGKAEQ